MLSELRPYRRRLVVLVILAALAGAAVAELSTPAKTSTATSGQGHH